jgi:hypothetical protein
MASAAIQGNYSTNPMDYLNGTGGTGGTGSLGSIGGAGALGAASGLSGGGDQQIMQLIQELIEMFQQELQNSGGNDSGGGSTPPPSTSSGGGGAMAPSGGSSGGGGAAPPSGCSGGGAVAPTGGATPTGGSTGAGASATGLSTTPQTTANSQAQGQQVAAQYVTNLMHDFNLTKPQAQGIVANLWHESGGMNSGINQGGKIGAPSGNMADDNANGYGIAQWGGSRKEGLIAYAKANGLDPSSQAANYGYLKQELQTTESGAISAVKNTSTAQGATEAFCNTFEQPSDPEMASRLADLALVQSA